MCHVPLFYLTKEIGDGPPNKECIKEVIEDVYVSSKNFFTIMGLALLGCTLFQLCLVGGMPPSIEDNKHDHSMRSSAEMIPFDSTIE